MSLLGPDGRKQLKLASRVSAVGLELVFATCIGYFGGRWLDGYLGSEPWLTYVGLLVGVLAGFKGLWYFARRTDLHRVEG
jgi:ATP synthase protein I